MKVSPFLVQEEFWADLFWFGLNHSPIPNMPLLRIEKSITNSIQWAIFPKPPDKTRNPMGLRKSLAKKIKKAQFPFGWEFLCVCLESKNMDSHPKHSSPIGKIKDHRDIQPQLNLQNIIWLLWSNRFSRLLYHSQGHTKNKKCSFLLNDCRRWV